MKVLILNRGSSSIKSCLFDLSSPEEKVMRPLWESHLQWKNTFDAPSLHVKNAKGIEVEETIKEKSAAEALKRMMDFLCHEKTAMLNSLEEVKVVGHRVVHGGRYFKNSVRIDSEVKKKIGIVAELAPLHNPAQLEAIEILENIFTKVPHIAVFDTAFHHTLSDAAAVYPVPYRWYEEGIQRYGFHGISFQYCSKRAVEMLGENTLSKMVICHLGSGASLCAVKDGKSIDTTMGFTPLEGLMMDTRCGSIDPGILLHLLESKKKTLEELSKELYEASGLLGVSGISSDMRDILGEKNSRSQLAVDIYLHRLNSCIGSMISSLQGVDVFVFTAGIGENASLIRERVCEHFSFSGVKIDKDKNNRVSSEDVDLSSRDSKVKILLIHTQEAFEIAKECLGFVK